MSLRKDKQKVLGENFDDERIKSFLEILPAGETNADFHVLEKAYRGMNAENFASFVRFFIESGRNINAPNPEGNTFLAVISTHLHAKAYVDALKNAGAKCHAG